VRGQKVDLLTGERTMYDLDGSNQLVGESSATLGWYNLMVDDWDTLSVDDWSSLPLDDKDAGVVGEL
jgi:hypothetical protein